MLAPGNSAGTPARDQGSGGSLPGPDAGHPLHRADSHDGDDEDQGAEREWEPRREPRGRTTSLSPGRARTADKSAPQVTDLSERSGRPRRNLRIRRLGVRVPPSAPSSAAIFPPDSSALANGFANSRVIPDRDRAREDVRRLSYLIRDNVRADPQRHRWISVTQAGRHHMNRYARQQQGCPVDVPEIMKPGVTGTNAKPTATVRSAPTSASSRPSASTSRSPPPLNPKHR
jgi:hypothetical protein